GRGARKNSAADAARGRTAVGGDAALGRRVRTLTQTTKPGDFLVPAQHADITNQLAAGPERLCRSRLLKGHDNDIVAGLQRTDLVHVGLVIEIHGAVGHRATTRTTFIMGAAAAFQVQLLAGNIDAQHTAIYGFRLRQPIKKARTIKDIYARTIS